VFKGFRSVVQDVNARTLSFNIVGDIAVIDAALIKELKRIGVEQNQTLRISLHSNPSEALHNMLIYVNNGAPLNIHKHKQKEETYHIVEGKMAVVFFSQNGEIQRKVILSKEDSLLCRVPKNQYHTSIALSDFALYHESRVGPFEGGDSIMANWCDNFSRDSLLRKVVE